MDPLHATIEEFAADGYTHIECHCPRCREIRLRPISYLPRISRASPSHSFQHGSDVSSAEDTFNPSSRGVCRICWASLSGAEDDFLNDRVSELLRVVLAASALSL
jgi:hypothetical protein